MVKRKTKWPKRPYTWIENRTKFYSIPFTWNLPEVKAEIMQRDFFVDKYVVGGPALNLMPNYFDGLEHVSVSKNSNGILQKINPLATKTTLGCPKTCKFCGIGQNKIEAGDFIELDDWSDLPIIVDNNLLAASTKHFDKVIDRLIKWEWCDFNQGLDSIYLTAYHAKKIAKIKKPMVRLALDHSSSKKDWSLAYENLRSAGIAKTNIRSYVLIGYDDDPWLAWDKCNWIEAHGVLALPQWFHELDALECNVVTEKQKKLRWTDRERKKIMSYFYQHRGLNNDRRKEFGE